MILEFKTNLSLGCPQVNQLQKPSPEHEQGSATSKLIPNRGQPTVLPQCDGVQDDYDDVFDIPLIVI